MVGGVSLRGRPISLARTSLLLSPHCIRSHFCHLTKNNSESGDVLFLFDAHLRFRFSVHTCTTCEFHPPQSLPLPSQIFQIPLYCFFPKGTKRNKKEASYTLRAIKLYFQAGIVHADLKPANVLWSQEEVGDVLSTSVVYVD